MAFEVIDGNDGFVQSKRQGLGRVHADHQRGDKSWSRGDRNRVDVFQFDPRLREGEFYGRQNFRQVGPGRHLRHNAAGLAVH